MLQEINDPRGELIVLQRAESEGGLAPDVRAEHRRRIAELIAAHGERWEASLRAVGAATSEYRGGFPAVVSMSRAAFSRHGTRLLREHPFVEHIRFTDPRVYREEPDSTAERLRARGQYIRTVTRALRDAIPRSHWPVHFDTAGFRFEAAERGGALEIHAEGHGNRRWAEPVFELVVAVYLADGTLWRVVLTDRHGLAQLELPAEEAREGLRLRVLGG